MISFNSLYSHPGPNKEDGFPCSNAYFQTISGNFYRFTGIISFMAAAAWLF